MKKWWRHTETFPPNLSKHVEDVLSLINCLKMTMLSLGYEFPRSSKFTDNLFCEASVVASGKLLIVCSFLYPLTDQTCQSKSCSCSNCNPCCAIFVTRGS